LEKKLVHPVAKLPNSLELKATTEVITS